MKDNRGITLVELVVSISIFAVVMTGILSLVSMGTKLYSSEKADVNMQYEAQTALNLIMDYAMQADGVLVRNEVQNVVERNGSHGTRDVTTALLLGEFTNNGTAYEYTGIVITGDYNASVGELYMRQFTSKVCAATIADSANTLVDSILSLSLPDRQKYVMARYVDSMLVSPSASTLSVDPVTGHHLLHNPFALDIEVKMEAVSQKTVETKKVSDKVTFRNRIDSMLYQSLADSGFQEFIDED